MLIKKRILIGIFIFMSILLIGSLRVNAQYWQTLPPYNLLWPLWSPALSPVDPVTGVPTPLVSTLTNDTLLPLEPVLFWDPVRRDFPYILYNTPGAGGGLTFFDQYFGLNPWPPAYLLDPITGLPAPITLPVGFAALSPTPLVSFEDLVALANLYFISQYPPGWFPTSITSLLTAAQIWGLPPL